MIGSGQRQEGKVLAGDGRAPSQPLGQPATADVHASRFRARRTPSRSAAALNLRLKAFDLLQQTQKASVANADMAIVDIDEQSLSRLGQ